jgi:hypothetical protein
VVGSSAASLRGVVSSVTGATTANAVVGSSSVSPGVVNPNAVVGSSALLTGTPLPVSFVADAVSGAVVSPSGFAAFASSWAGTARMTVVGSSSVEVSLLWGSCSPRPCRATDPVWLPGAG